MNLKNYQTNFDFSRPFDLQKNLNNGFANNILNILETNKVLKNNLLFKRHFNFIITELFFVGLSLKINFSRYLCQKEVTIQIQDIIQIKFHHTALRLLDI